MDPFIEGQDWSSFHHRVLSEIDARLGPLLRPRYAVYIQRRVYVEHHEDTYLELRLRDTGDVVAVIELLSPANKRAHSDGRREYLTKRDEVVRSRTHLLEVDLLRGGERLPMAAPLPPGDYYVIVSRAERRPDCDVWAVHLRSVLPSVPVPLAGADADVELDLQAVVDAVHERAGYAELLDYGRPLEPAPNGEAAAWIAARLREAGKLAPGESSEP